MTMADPLPLFDPPTSSVEPTKAPGKPPRPNSKVYLVPITIGDAKAYIEERHRHHKHVQGGLFAVAAGLDERVVGVAIVGRPVARHSDDGWTAEVTRLCTDGTPNACSILYAAAWRAARALGYRRIVTFTLPEEGGGRLCGRRGGDAWGRRAEGRGAARSGLASTSIRSKSRSSGRWVSPSYPPNRHRREPPLLG
jgi:hypothetical protein